VPGGQPLEDGGAEGRGRRNGEFHAIYPRTG
jgi:hypothetical protein